MADAGGSPCILPVVLASRKLRTYATGGHYWILAPFGPCYYLAPRVTLWSCLCLRLTRRPSHSTTTVAPPVSVMEDPVLPLRRALWNVTGKVEDLQDLSRPKEQGEAPELEMAN